MRLFFSPKVTTHSAPGTPDKEELFTAEQRQVMITVANIVALINVILCFFFAILLYERNNQLIILQGGITEGLLFLFVPILNRLGRPQAAGYLMFYTQALAVLFFGAILGKMAQVQTMSIFLAGIALLVFRQRKPMIIALLFIVLIVLLLEINYSYHFIATLPLAEKEFELLRQMVIGTVLFLNSVMLFIYARLRTQQHKKMVKYATELERARQAMTIFVRETTHELRAPLNGINSITEYYMQGAENAKENIPISAHHLKTMQVACNKLRSVVNNVQDFSKIEAGHTDESVKEAFDLQRWLDETVALYRELALAQSVRLIMIQSGTLPGAIISDKTKLNSILSNLLSNAIKFTARNTVVSLKVTISENTLMLEVSDKGKGLTPEEQQRIFEPFATTRTPGNLEGTGLGLPIARKKAEELGGSLTLQSELGTGTTFIVTLPLEVANQVEAVAQIADDTPMRFEGMVALVTDDDNLSRLAVKLLLTRLGIYVIEVGSLVETMDRIKESLFDLVLLDLHLPDGSGTELLGWLRSDTSLSHVPPVIVVTGDIYDDTKAAIMSAGAQGIVTKPVEFKQLYTELKKLFRSTEIV